MIESIKISGFKNFRGKTIELKGLNRINLLVGINGSGKSSVLELLMGVSKLSQLNDREEQDILVGSLAPRLHSLFEPETSITFRYTTSPEPYSLKITPQPGDRWRVEKRGSPKGGTDVIALLKPGTVPYNDRMTSLNRNEHPFGGIAAFKSDDAIVLPDLNNANEILSKVNPTQRTLRPLNLSSGQFTFEGDKEIQTKFLAGGSRYIAGLVAAVRHLRNSTPIFVIDDLGDELFPAVRKRLVPELNALIEDSPENQFTQVFATTHNVEIVKSALNHPEYCSVYMFNYDGGLVEFDASGQRIVNASTGIESSEAIPAISKMLGIEDIDLGYPEMVILVEEESKKTFLQALSENDHIKQDIRKLDVLVPFQVGDGNTSEAIHNLLDLSKYFFFSEVWSDRYAIFVDYTPDDYESNGLAKSNRHRQKALAVAQSKLGLGDRYLLTKKGDNYVPSLEDTYPKKMWDYFKATEKINFSTIADYLNSVSSPSAKGKLKHTLAQYVGKNITKEDFKRYYPNLSRLVLTDEPLLFDEHVVLRENSITDVNTDTADVDMYQDAKRLVILLGKASASLLQRRLSIGYARAARIMDKLEEEGIVSPQDGARPRDVLVNSIEELDD